MSLEPGQQVVWIGDLFIDERAPMALCATHVARVSVPSGWGINDVRDSAPAFWRDDDDADDTADRPACVATNSRARRRWSSGKMDSIPGLFDDGPVQDPAEAAVVAESGRVAEPEQAVVTQVALIPAQHATESSPRQSLDGLSAVYGSDDAGDTSTDEPSREDELIDSLLAASTPLLSRAFRNARAS